MLSQVKCPWRGSELSNIKPMLEKHISKKISTSRIREIGTTHKS